MFYLIIVLLIIFIYICRSKKFSNFTSNLLFLNSAEAKNIFRIYSRCQYMNIPNCLEYQLATVMEFTDAEKAMLSTYYQNSQIKKSDFNLYLIKISDDFAHSRWYTMGNNYIIAPQKDLVDLSENEFVRIMNHEIMHLYQRQHFDEFDQFYQKIGFIKVKNSPEFIGNFPKIPDEILNPDDFTGIRYLYQFGQKLILTTMIETDNGSEFTIIILSPDYRILEIYNINNVPAEYINYILNFWRRFAPYELKDLLEDGYSPNEVLAHLRER